VRKNGKIQNLEPPKGPTKEPVLDISAVAESSLSNGFYVEHAVIGSVAERKIQKLHSQIRVASMRNRD